MSRLMIHSTLTTLALVIGKIALAQAPAEAKTLTIPVGNSYVGDWQIAHQAGSSRRMLLVVTLDQPQRKQSCRIKTFTNDRLVCSRAFAGEHTYLPQQVLALILPGDDAIRIKLLLGFNAGLGASIWGTVVLAPACPVCAAATGIAALWFFGAAGVTLIADGQSERLLYRAPNHEMTGRLRNILPIGEPQIW